MNSTIEQQNLVLPKTVFITGASGFIGRALSRRCRDLGIQVTGLDFKADPEWGVIGADLTAVESWCAALEGVELVIHTAAIVSNTATADEAWRVNVKATADLLAHCVTAGVSRFVQLSSVAAYGFDFVDARNENQPLRPMGNTYVDSKIASEHAVLACHGSTGLDCTIVRPGDVYGPGSRPWSRLPLEMIQQGKFLLPAHGRGLFSPVYIDDLVEGLMLAALKPEGRGEIFNISGGIEPTCNEFFGHYARMASCAVPRTVSTPLAMLLAEAGRMLINLFGGSTELGRGAIDMLSRRGGYSIAKAGAVLGFDPATDLGDGMALTEEWARKEGLI
jgi:nucleoside-diphosphate-sugar epimerase